MSNKVEKMPVAKQAIVRKDLYEIVTGALDTSGYATETIVDGSLIDLGEGQYAVLKISIKDPEKFDLQAARAAQAEKLQKQAERTEAAALRQQEKAEKAKAAAEKAAKKASGDEVGEPDTVPAPPMI